MKNSKFLVIGLIVVIAILSVFLMRASQKKTGEVSGTENNLREHSEKESEEHGERDVVHLEKSEMKASGIKVETAVAKKIRVYVSLPGEVVPNADNLVHLVPRVSGVVRAVRKSLGDQVQAGEVLAVLESRDLADAQAAYLAASERYGLTQSIFLREETLWQKNITSEQEYLEAKQAFAEGRIALRSTYQKLLALGFSDTYLRALPYHQGGEGNLTRYEITAPFAGTVIAKHISTGLVLKEETDAFVIADLSTVWVDLSVFQKDLPLIQKGLDVVISAGHGIPDAVGTVSYLGPIVGEKTRTALARVEISNADGNWRPGLFINGRIVVKKHQAAVTVPASAIQTKGTKTFVFIVGDEPGEFMMREVRVGAKDIGVVEILSGIQAGDLVVATGGFLLRSELEKSGFTAGHGH